MFFFCWNRIMALRKIKHNFRDDDADYSNFRLCWDCLFLVVLYYFQSRFTRITTHSCYTVGCCASESQSKGLRHVRTYNGSGEKEDNEWRLHHNITTSVATNILSTVLMCSAQFSVPQGRDDRKLYCKYSTSEENTERLVVLFFCSKIGTNCARPALKKKWLMSWLAQLEKARPVRLCLILENMYVSI